MEETTSFNLPKQTHDIFAVMARGAFISSNGSRDGMNRLYDVINNPENFDKLASTEYKVDYAQREVHNQIIEAMIAHPILVNRPFVVSPKGIKLCRPSELVFELLDNPPKGFTKEDGQQV